MNDMISRRSFLQAAVAGTVGVAASGILGGRVLASAEGQEPENTIIGFDGKAKFAGVGSIRHVADDVVYIGASERRTQLFENVYPIPRGVSYNSYVLLDEKTVLFDTVDRSVSGQFFENLEIALDGRTLDYMIVNHMEPDHSSAITEVLVRYPNVKIVCTAAAAAIMNQFFDFDVTERAMTVGEGDSLTTGKHTLVFVMAPMVHWPEVMMTYDTVHGILFSADAFGSFGALNGNLFADEVNFETEWLPDARRYYTNIVGKYGKNVQDVLAKAATVDIKMFCPLHGPIWRENLGWLLDKYDKWSSYTPEEDAVMVVYGSVYGGTESAANALASCISQKGVRNVAVYDVSKTHVSELIAEAFRCSHIVFASITYNMGIFTPMKNFLMDLAAHNLQNRTVSIMQNGSWSPASGGLMIKILEEMQDIRFVGNILTFRSAPKASEYDSIAELADAIVASIGAEPEAAAEESAAAGGTTWVCGICGYVYEGEEMPDDFKCPICGQGKDRFNKTEG